MDEIMCTGNPQLRCGHPGCKPTGLSGHTRQSWQDLTEQEKAGGLFVISDTRERGLLDKRPPRDPIMIEAFRAIKEHWEESGSSDSLRT